MTSPKNILFLESVCELKSQRKNQQDEEYVEENAKTLPSKTENEGSKIISTGEQNTSSNSDDIAEKNFDDKLDGISNIDQSLSEILNLGKRFYYQFFY